MASGGGNREDERVVTAAWAVPQWSRRSRLKRLDFTRARVEMALEGCSAKLKCVCQLSRRTKENRIGLRCEERPTHDFA